MATTTPGGTARGTDVIERTATAMPPVPGEPRPGAAVSLEMVNVFGEPVAEGSDAGACRLRLTAWVNNVSYVKDVWVDAYLLGARGDVVGTEALPLTFHEGAGGGGDFFILDVPVPTGADAAGEGGAARLQYRLYYRIGDAVYTDGILHDHALGPEVGVAARARAAVGKVAGRAAGTAAAVKEAASKAAGTGSAVKDVASKAAGRAAVVKDAATKAAGKAKSGSPAAKAATKAVAATAAAAAVTAGVKAARSAVRTVSLDDPDGTTKKAPAASKAAKPKAPKAEPAAPAPEGETATPPSARRRKTTD